MSKYMDAPTEFKDGELLIEALCDMGFQKDAIRNCIGNPQHLEGYQGDQRKEVADIIIPRKHVGGAANDIGFVRGANGKYSAVISDYDRGSNGYNAGWLQKLTLSYADKNILKTARNAGLKPAGKKIVGDETEYIFVKA